jgi:hypothetical protein
LRKMYRDRSKSGGKVRVPASSEEAAIFRAACKRLGIDHTNCHHRLGISKTPFYEYGNGETPIPVPVSKLLDSIEAYAKLKAMFDELEAELKVLKERVE